MCTNYIHTETKAMGKARYLKYFDMEFWSKMYEHWYKGTLRTSRTYIWNMYKTKPQIFVK